MSEPIRSSFSVAWSVWRALLLREALGRISGGRAPWVWLLIEPILHMAFMVFVMTVIRHRVVGGIDAAVWIMVGMLAFFLFRRTATQGQNGINANKSLFAYRQVRPVDTVLVRSVLEGILMLIISLPVLFGAAMVGKIVLPDNPLLVFSALSGLWLFALGFGLITSVATELIQESDHIIKFLMMPLYLISGAIFPLVLVPYPYQEWLLYNPIAHGLEAVRLGYSNYYHAVPRLDVGYLFSSASVLIFIGLALHVRFTEKLISK